MSKNYTATQGSESDKAKGLTNMNVLLIYNSVKMSPDVFETVKVYIYVQSGAHWINVLLNYHFPFFPGVAVHDTDTDFN